MCWVCLQSTNSKYEVAGVSSDDPVSLIYKVSGIGKRSELIGREGGREGGGREGGREGRDKFDTIFGYMKYFLA